MKTRLKTAVAVLGVFCLGLLSMIGSDINPGYTFSSGEKNVTHTKLNSLVDAATINSSFISGKSVATPVAADSFLFYSVSAGDFRRATYDTMLLGQTTLISSQTELNTPQTNDYVLVLTAAGLFRKSSLNSLTWTNADLIANRTNWDSPNLDTTYFLAYDQGNYSKVLRSRLLTFTNAVMHTAPTNNDALLIWDSVAGTNKQITLARLITNAPAATVATNGDFLLGYSTNDAAVVKYTPLQLTRFVTSSVPTLVYTNSLPMKFVTGESNVVPGKVSDVAHGLTGRPQSATWVIVCKTNDVGYVIGDEVDVAGIYEGGTGVVIFTGGANATNVFLTCDSSVGSVNLRRKDTGAVATITAVRWRAKCYATYFP